MNNQGVACIAGGTSGIGKSTTSHLLSEGWNVVAVGRTAKHAEELLTEVEREDSSRLTVKYGDLRNYDTCEEIANYIKETHGKLDVLVNSVGTIGSGGVQEETIERWNLVVTSNLTSVFNMTKACCDLLKSTPQASVVNISSVCSLRPCASVSYSVSKAGLDMFTKVVARELAPFDVRVNSVNPSVVRSNLQKSAGLFEDNDSYEEWINRMKPSHPLGRVGDPSDVVGAIRYLISTDASWVTGAIIAVDGGRAIA